MNMTLPDRIYAQYRNKPKAVAWYEITRSLAAQLNNTAQAVRVMYNIDTATGAQLDIIGDIVVTGGRSYEAEISFTTSNWGAAQFGGANTQYASVTGVTSKTISDMMYRKMIKSKIVKNNGDATIDGICDALEFIIGESVPRLIDHEDMSFSIEFGVKLDSITTLLLNNFDIIPKPQGVRFRGYTDAKAVTQWGGDKQWGGEYSQYGQYF